MQESVTHTSLLPHTDTLKHAQARLHMQIRTHTDRHTHIHLLICTLQYRWLCFLEYYSLRCYSIQPGSIAGEIYAISKRCLPTSTSKAHLTPLPHHHHHHNHITHMKYSQQERRGESGSSCVGDERMSDRSSRGDLVHGTVPEHHYSAAR